MLDGFDRWGRSAASPSSRIPLTKESRRRVHDACAIDSDPSYQRQVDQKANPPSPQAMELLLPHRPHGQATARQDSKSSAPLTFARSDQDFVLQPLVCRGVRIDARRLLEAQVQGDRACPKSDPRIHAAVRDLTVRHCAVRHCAAFLGCWMASTGGVEVPRVRVQGYR